MTHITLISIVATALFVQSTPKVSDPNDAYMDTLKVPSNIDQMNRVAESTHAIWVNAKAFSDMESVVLAMSETTHFSRDAVLTLIRSHRIQADKSLPPTNKIGDVLKKNMITILDGNKAIKEAETLRKELDRLRKHKSDSRPVGGLGGASN